MTSSEPSIDLPLVHSGKVRDVYDAGDGLLLMVASDRISAFDVVMAEAVPHKGRVLTAMSVFWFEQLAHIVGNHLVSVDPADFPAGARVPGVEGRSMLVRRAEMVPIECVVRGHLAGSAWQEYRTHGTMHGTPLPAGLVEADRLPEPAFTPATKAPDGLHDENISFDEAAAIVGADTATACRDIALALYRAGADLAAERGFIVADTKFELGFVDGTLVVADEILTPDSSRFWPADGWMPGSTPPSFDKQPVRDFLAGLDWDRTPPAPPLPPDVVAATTARYVEAYERITGRSLADWP